MIFAFFIQPAKALTRGVFQMSFPISLDKGFPPGLCFALLQAPHGSTAFPLLPGTAFKRCLSAQALTDSFTSSSQTVPSAPEILQESQTRDALGAFDQESLSHSQVLLMQMSSCTRSLPAPQSRRNQQDKPMDSPGVPGCAEGTESWPCLTRLTPIPGRGRTGHRALSSASPQQSQQDTNTGLQPHLSHCLLLWALPCSALCTALH